ncbi:MAG TPA: lysophospholipid acyltransferase family protein [Opitutaceae bacterium]|nr:lysophospholipid acyltransferase family protein [Opitutaceae bacterium]
MNVLYWFCHGLIRTVADTAFRGEVIGLENVPREGPFLMASNHCSHLDPPLLGSQLQRQIHFFARKTLWKPGFPAWWLDAVETIPVDRDGADVGAMKRTIAALENGGVVIVFPEGTRSLDGRLQPAKAGVGMIACKARVPVVPARIFGSFEAFGRDAKIPKPHPVSYVIGRPLAPAEYDDPAAGKQRYQVASERIMAAIAALELPARPLI